MNVFADFHHAGLYYSLHKLFKERLGWNLFRPIGLEWFEKGFWDIAKPYNNNYATVKQYLSLDNYQPLDGTPPLNTITQRGFDPLAYRVKDVYHDFEMQAITFQQFMELDIDIIIASIPDHWETYTRLRDVHKPKAKVVCQMGNMFNEVHSLMSQGKVKNLMASTIEFTVSKNVNAVFYHQEQPLRPYKEPSKTMRISSYVHLLPRPEVFEAYKTGLPEFALRAFGASSPDGWMSSLEGLYDSIQQDMFVYHVKPMGDGYGWNWHTAFMLGRPVITNYSDYHDKLGGMLFEDGVTGLNLEAHTVRENCELIRKWTDEDYYLTLSENTYRKFSQVVHYDSEEQKLRSFFENLA